MLFGLDGPPDMCIPTTSQMMFRRVLTRWSRSGGAARAVAMDCDSSFFPFKSDRQHQRYRVHMVIGCSLDI